LYFIIALHSTGKSVEGAGDHINNEFILETISNISTHPQLVSQTIPLLVKHFKHLVTESSKLQLALLT
jgi:hypothetical protein